jgi:Ca2+-binding EF-hand superfamily protein
MSCLFFGSSTTELRSRISELEIQLNSLRSDKRRIEGQMESQAQELNAAREGLASASKRLSELDSLQTSKIGLEPQLASKVQALVAAQAENTELRSRISELDSFFSEYSDSEELKKLKDKANRLLEKKSESFIKELFKRHSHDRNGKTLVSATGLQAALKELADEPVTLEKASALVKMHDIDENGALDEQEFHRAIKIDPSPLEMWAETLPLSDLLAACLQGITVSDSGSDSVRQLICISEDRLEVAVEAFTSCLLKTLLPEQIALLKNRIELQDEKAKEASSGASAKFTVYKMNAGDIKDTQKSLSERIGESLTWGRLTRVCSF